ncbi:PhoH family protein [Desulfitibacter alkalitolerans]|uniref:PhoH family protein n=1 Tax=Desulfitibacter alkalitolerans TaxID=264641 RepID=UPI00048792D6|nr:PhoH family protein [Desulfitibacter alkalitolerans]
MSQTTEIRITLPGNGEEINVLGRNDENLRFIAKHSPVKIVARGNELSVTGQEQDVINTEKLFNQLIKLASKGNQINIPTINYAMKQLAVLANNDREISDILSEVVSITARGKQIKAKTIGQYDYIKVIKNYDIVFGIGPAGTGKTYLAVVMAVEALRNKLVQRIILVRPAVEAGEKLGFLPGDLQDKVNPYLRPLYDGLYDILGLETAAKYMEKEIIEVAPLAYMRGRTLEDSFIILDEAQNTTPDQMKMFLTRMGFGSKAVITGDITQVDLPKGNISGLINAQRILKNVDGICFKYFTEQDVVRHPLVQKIILAYEREKKEMD